MRRAPSLSSRRAEGVSSQRVRRPTRSDTSSPSAAARASAWRADFSVTPKPASVSTSTHVQTGRPAGSTNSPSTVISRDLALVCRTSRRRMTSGGRAASPAVIGRLPPPWPEPLVAASGYGTQAWRAAGHARRRCDRVRVAVGCADRPDWCRQASPTGARGWEDQQMAQGARLGSVVMFVHDLDRSVEFYADVLALETADRSPTAALLTSPAGAGLILRAMGQTAPHPLGSIGVQYAVWTAAGEEDLARCERVLAGRGAHRGTRSNGGLTVVEGRDPDDIVLIVTYPGPDQLPLRELPVRIYGW